MISSPFFSLVTLAFLTMLLIAKPTLTGAATVGVAYGRDGNNLPSPREVVDLYRSQGIGAMRIYWPDPEVLQALKGSGIELVLGVPNTDLQQLASDIPSAQRWVRTNVLNYPDVKVKYISVGNEVTPVNPQSRYATFVVPAMTNIFNAVKDAGLFQKVRVSTTLDTSVIDEKTSYPPSAGNFRRDVMWFMNPIIGFLTDTNQPILFTVYPYYAYISNNRIKLPYVLFTQQSPEFTDNGLKYYNLFDAMLDGVYSALEKNSGPAAMPAAMLNGTVSSSLRRGYQVKAVITETGYRHTPGPPRGHGRRTLLASEDACTYYENLVKHVTSIGTPKRPGPIETYLFAMFDEDKKPEDQRNFGIFGLNKQPRCAINFHGT
ncbi:glucan endo-1,3-beta-glucosidase-like [Apium graveolens]|uniref:glucan endo-1,3-beta-glucosidase-like n=1 Tax=Apium graveolens TaxID=4045 RepID=UPI003D7AAAE6